MIEVEVEGVSETIISCEMAKVNTRRAVAAAMIRILQHAVRRSKLNAPLLKKRGDSDFLRNRIYALLNGRRITGQGARTDIAVDQVDEFEGKIVAESEYAIAQHENLTPAGPWQLGPVSAVQPSTIEGGVGGKFIQRVIDYHQARYNRLIASASSKGFSLATQFFGPNDLADAAGAEELEGDGSTEGGE